MGVEGSCGSHHGYFFPFFFNQVVNLGMFKLPLVLTNLPPPHFSAENLTSNYTNWGRDGIPTTLESFTDSSEEPSPIALSVSATTEHNTSPTPN